MRLWPRRRWLVATDAREQSVTEAELYQPAIVRACGGHLPTATRRTLITVSVVREAHDRDSIAIISLMGDVLGYLPKRDARAWRRHLPDRGITTTAAVRPVDDAGTVGIRVGLALR